MRKKKPKGPTLVEYVAEYGRQTDILPASILSNEAVVRAIQKWAGRSLLVSELTDDLFNDWVLTMSSNGLAKATARSYRGRLLAMWRAGYRAGHCKNGPGRIRTVKLPFKAPVAWSVEEVRQLLGVAESLRLAFKHSNVYRADYFGLAIRLAWDTALRMRDLMRLKKGDFDAERLAVVTQNKTGRWHTVRIHKSTHELMKQFEPDDDRALPWSISECNFQHQFRRLVTKAGLKGPWKKIRKSSATNVEISYPGAGAAHLGHVNGSVAHTNYLDPRLMGFSRPMPAELTAADIETKFTPELRLMQYAGIFNGNRDVTQKTALRYRTVVAHLGRWAGGPISCGQLTEQMITEFHRDITRDGKLRDETVRRRCVKLTNLLRGIRAELQDQPPATAPEGIS